MYEPAKPDINLVTHSIRVFGLTQNIIECAGMKTEMALKQQNLQFI